LRKSWASKCLPAKGKVEIQAQGDEMTLDALKDIRISSSEGKLIISAKQEIILTSGGYIRIADGGGVCGPGQNHPAGGGVAEVWRAEYEPGGAEVGEQRI
jgi:hypothetical protein